MFWLRSRRNILEGVKVTFFCSKLHNYIVKLPVTSVLVFGPVTLCWSVEHSLIWWVKELFICLTDLQYRQIYHFVSCLFIFFLFLSTQWEFLYRLCLSVGICMESVGIFLIIKQWCSQKHLFHCVVFIFTIKLSPKVVWRSCVWTKIEHKNNTSKNEPNASTQMERRESVTCVIWEDWSPIWPSCEHRTNPLFTCARRQKEIHTELILITTEHSFNDPLPVEHDENSCFCKFCKIFCLSLLTSVLTWNWSVSFWSTRYPNICI